MAGETASGDRYIRESSGGMSRIRRDNTEPSLAATLAKAGKAILDLFGRR
jgi:hypothetical protein